MNIDFVHKEPDVRKGTGSFLCPNGQPDIPLVYHYPVVLVRSGWLVSESLFIRVIN
jgi:hypothetical protein